MRWRDEDFYANFQVDPAGYRLPNWGAFLVYFPLSQFWVDLSEIVAKTLSSQSQINELLLKRYMLTVKQLQPAVSFITEVFALFDFRIQFIFDSQI